MIILHDKQNKEIKIEYGWIAGVLRREETDELTKVLLFKGKGAPKSLILVKESGEEIIEKIVKEYKQK